MTSGGAQIFGLPSFLPVILNDALSTMFLFLVIASLGSLLISHFNQNLNNKYIYSSLVLVAVLGFFTGALFSQTNGQTLGENVVSKTPESVKDNVPRITPKNHISTSKSSTQRVFTPRTPKELMDIAETETERDAMKHKGTWINVEGSVVDIGEASVPIFSLLKKREYYIKIEVGIGPPPQKLFQKKIYLYLKNDKWKKQIDKIRRGDWIVAAAIVHRVSQRRIEVIDGEIISVYGPDKGRK